MKRAKSFLPYVLKRLGLMLLTFFIIFTLCFFLIRLLPTSYSPEPGKDEEVYLRIRELYGYDKPILEQYFLFIKNLFVPASYVDGSGKTVTLSRFGYSWIIESRGLPDQMLFSRLPATLFINVYSLVISIPLGLLLGAHMALHRNKSSDVIWNVVVIVSMSVPAFVLAFFLQYLFGSKWHLLPISMPALSYGGSINWFAPKIQRAFILPVLSSSIGTICSFARFTRGEFAETLSQPFILSCRSNGLSKKEIMFKHVFRNSLVPIFPVILGQIVSLFSGSIVIEQVFGIPGVGHLFLESITQKDYDLFLFVSSFYVLLGLLASLVVDVSYSIIDPRVRMGGRKLDA